MTLPPTVPCALVAWDPTMADASASAVSRSRTAGSAAISSCVTSAPRRSRPSEVARPRSSSMPMDGDDALGERRLALPGADDQVGAARDRASAARQRRERVVEALRRDERGGQRPFSAAAAQTRSGVIGSSRTRAPDHLGDRVRDRARRRHGRRLCRLPWCRSGRRSRPASRSTRRRSAARRRRSRACSRGGAGCAGGPPRRAASASRSACPIPITTPPNTWPVAPSRLMIVPESWTAATCRTRTTPVSRSTLTRTAWVKTCGSRNDSLPRRPRQPSRVARRVLGHGARALADEGRRPTPASSAIVDRLRRGADDAHLAAGELEVLARHLELLGGEVEQLVAHLDGGLDDGAAVVEGRLRAGRAHVPRRRVGVLVEDREVGRAASRAPRRRGAAAPSRRRCRSPARR